MLCFLSWIALTLWEGLWHLSWVVSFSRVTFFYHNQSTHRYSTRKHWSSGVSGPAALPWALFVFQVLLMRCGRRGKILAVPTTLQLPSVPSSGHPSATTSRPWTRTLPSGSAGAIPRSWSSTPPASSWGPTLPPRASTPPIPTPWSSGSMGCSSWLWTTKQMVRLHKPSFNMFEMW